MNHHFVVFAFLASLSCALAQNPFQGVQLYVNPDYQAEVQRTINANPSLGPLLSKAQNIPAAYWIDTIARITNVTGVLEGAKAKQASTGTKQLTAFVIYDLPTRDCAAAASNGELNCLDTTCAAGLATYKSQYIDPIVAIFKRYTTQPIVAIVEPDSLPNLATNLDQPKCALAQNAYKQGIAYAIKQLAAVGPSVTLYLDAAHGGWLGWDNNRQKAAQIFSEVLNLAGGPNLIRGFATNTANYQPLGSLSSSADPCNLKSQYNQAIDEAHYIQLLSQTFNSVGLTNKYFITDTSRNGITNERKDCSDWCNAKGAGLGERPSTNTQQTGLGSLLDAFVWIKTPGESDGTSNTTSPRYDFHCGSSDSYIPAPEAGSWFPDYFIGLAQNAIPPL